MAGDDGKLDNTFVGFFGLTQVLFCVMFSIFCDYNKSLMGLNGTAAHITQGTVEASYSFYTDVSLMIFIGASRIVPRAALPGVPSLATPRYADEPPQQLIII